jgi:murein DD-endopeptidase MepM/ murein hydrolase activator NlpD
MTELAIVTIPPEQVQRAGSLAGMVIKSADAEQTAINGLTFVQAIIRHNENARKELVAPLVRDKKAIDDAFKSAMAPFEDAETRLKLGIQGWRAAESKRIADEQARILRENAERERLAQEAALKIQAENEAKARAEAAEAKLSEAETQAWVAERAEVVPEVPVVLEQIPLSQQTTVKGAIGGYTARMVWKFTITDPTLVPRAYMVVDETRIRTAVNAGVRDIPGVDVYSEEQISGRRNK